MNPINTINEDTYVVAQWFFGVPPRAEKYPEGADFLMVLTQPGPDVGSKRWTVTSRLRVHEDDKVHDSSDIKIPHTQVVVDIDEDQAIAGCFSVAIGLLAAWGGVDPHYWQVKMLGKDVVAGLADGTLKAPPYMHVRKATAEEIEHYEQEEQERGPQSFGA